MDKKEDVQNYLDNVMFQEWLPEIHYHAKSIANKYPQRIQSPHELHDAGYMGLLAAIKNWTPEKAKLYNNSFRTHASNSIKGHMQDHATGIHSFGREGVVDPHVEAQSRAFSRMQDIKGQQPAEKIEADEPPPIPEDSKSTQGR